MKVGVEPSSASSEASQCLPNLPTHTSEDRLSPEGGRAASVHKGKGADVADPSHIHSEVPKEVDNLQGSGPKPEIRNKGVRTGRGSSTRETWRKQPRGREGLAEGNRTRPVGHLQPLGSPPLDPGGQPKAPAALLPA